VLAGGRLTLEDAYAYAKFARVALGSNDIDMRARPSSDEETAFLTERVAGRGGVSYASLQRAPAVLLAGFEPEDESPIVYLRLRKAARAGTLTVYSLAALASPGLDKLSGVLLPTIPGTEATALTAIVAEAKNEVTDGRARRASTDGTAGGSGGSAHRASTALKQDGAIILAGERLAEVPGALSAVAALADATGASLAWIPRRAGERGAIEAGALPTLLPGGRAVADAEASAEVATAWGVGRLPAQAGRDTAGILSAATDGELSALLVGGVDPADLPDPEAALAALETSEFVVSLELRVSAVTDRADVVFPVAAVAEKPGTFVNWEGRPGTFGAALAVPAARSDLQVLAAIADEMDVHLGLPDAASARREISALGLRTTSRDKFSPVAAAPLLAPGPGQAVLSTWHSLLDGGRMQDGDPNLAGTARTAVARMSAATAAQAGTADGGKVTVSTERGAVTVPVAVTEMPDRVVWLPANSAGRGIRRELAAGHGTLVTLRSAE
jgi:NADH-quinone oxidoreductase subunit G